MNSELVELQKEILHQTSDDGRFWIRWRDVCSHFSHLYTVWNSAQLGGEALMHGSWSAETSQLKETSLTDDSHLVAWMPQHLIEIPNIPVDPGARREVLVSLLLHRRQRKDSSRYVALMAHVGRGKI